MPDQLTTDRNLFTRVETYGDDFRDNETEFLESCAEHLGKAPRLSGPPQWLPNGKPLTPKMRKWLEDLDERRVR